MVACKDRPIYRDNIWIDPEIVNYAHKHGHNEVTYYCYHENDKSNSKSVYIPKYPLKENNAIELTGACFSALRGKLNGAENRYNRVLFHMQVDNKKACIKLTLEEQKRFIDLSVKHKMLPKYVTSDTLINDKEGRLVLMIEDLSPSLLYVYLSQYRYLREDPGFVKSILYLYELGFDFYAAFVLSSKITMDYVIHHVLTLQRPYGYNTSTVNVETVPFATIAGLKRYIRRPKKYDQRSVYSGEPYNASNTIESICDVSYQLTTMELLEPTVKKAFSALTDVVARKYMNKYQKIKNRIKYRSEGAQSGLQSSDSK